MARLRSGAPGAWLTVALGGLVLLSATPVSAQAPVTVATFLARANALKAQGIAAMFSPEIKALRDLGAAAGAEYRARLARERTAGQPSSCPPPKTQIASDQFLAHLETYPAPVRERTTLAAAVGDLFARKWPCR